MAGEGEEDVPRDAKIVKSLLKSMGVEDYEPRVIHQFLELWYRYVVEVLTDAQVYSEHASKSNIDCDDVKLAIQSKVNFGFSQPPPRECARQGFALALTLPVSVIPSINVESLLKLIADSLSVSSSMKGQDVKECLLGRLFAYGALARSGRLIEDWQSDNDSQIIKEFTNALIGLAAKRRYLQEPAVHVLLHFVEKLQSFKNGLNKPLRWETRMLCS